MLVVAFRAVWRVSATRFQGFGDIMCKHCNRTVTTTVSRPIHSATDVSIDTLDPTNDPTHWRLFAQLGRKKLTVKLLQLGSVLSLPLPQLLHSPSARCTPPPTSLAHAKAGKASLTAMRNTLIFAGNSCPVLTGQICENLGMQPANAELTQFANVSLP